eukprot:g36833.t1
MHDSFKVNDGFKTPPGKGFRRNKDKTNFLYQKAIEKNLTNPFPPIKNLPFLLVDRRKWTATHMYSKQFLKFNLVYFEPVTLPFNEFCSIIAESSPINSAIILIPFEPNQGGCFTDIK